jgi:hypothetical protein
MSNEKKGKLRKLVIFAIAMGLCLTAIQIGAVTTTSPKSDQNILKIPKVKLGNEKFTMCPNSMKLTEISMAKTMSGNLNAMTLGVDMPVMVMAEDIDVQNPSIMDNGAGNIVIASEAWEDIFTSNIFLRYSNDGGETWIPENSVLSWTLPENELMQSLPTIDFAGDNGGFGAMVPVDPPTLITITFDDISDHEAGDGWLPNPWTTDSHIISFDSTDACGVNSQFAPDSAATGIVVYTADESSGETNILYIGWHEGEGTLRGLWTGSGDDRYEWENAVCDTDLSTGMFYDAYRIYDDKTGDPLPDGVELEWCQLDGTGDWWQGDWYYIHIDGADNPDVKADDGNCYLVYELDGAIECLYSNDNAGNFQTVTITNDGQFPAVTAVGETVVCSYTRNGNLYTSISENGGSTWEESPQINDVSGSVVEQFHCADVSGAFVTWTDNRDGLNGIYFDNSAEIEVPIVEIKDISGGIGVKVDIENTGTADATDVQWSIDLEGGLVLLGKHAEGTIPTLAMGSSETVKIPFVLGLGGSTVKVTADTASQQKDCMVLIFFVAGL